MRAGTIVVGLLGCWCFSGCDSGRTPQLPPPRPRPVTVFELREFQPPSSMRHTGSVTSWKTEDISFEVGGRVQTILEPGTNVDGPDIEEDGRTFVPRTGEVLARLEPSRYVTRLASARASEATAEARLEAARREIDTVLPRQIAAATASQRLAEQEFERHKQLRASNASTQAAYDKAAADLQVAIAQLQQLESTVAVREAEKASCAAQVDEAREAVRQAEKDLADATLHAPFTGQVAEVYENIGGVVQPGHAVLRLQMMDPMQVDVQVSAERDAQLQYNDLVTVFSPDTGEPLPAMVYEKATLADAATRTFLVKLLFRNEKLLDGMPAEYDAERDVRVRSLWPLFTFRTGNRPPYYVNEESLHDDGRGGWFVLRVRELSKGTAQRTGGGVPTVLTVERVSVVPSSERVSFLNVAVMRRLEDIGNLNPDQDVVAGLLRSMDGRPLEGEAEAKAARSLERVHFVRERWRFRPGDVVGVDLAPAPPPLGWYVPMDAVVRGREGSGEDFLFTVESSESGGDGAARRIAVHSFPDDYSGTLVRIEPAVSGTLTAGMRIIRGGVHYLQEGEAVRVTANEEVAP